MRDWQSVVIKPDTTIIDTIKIIDASAMQIAIVADGNGKLLGTVTDGDIRRGILRNISLEQSIEKVMNPNPKIALLTDKRNKIIKLLKNGNIKHIPIVSEEGTLVDVISFNDILLHDKKDNPVVLMAGGFGTRLRPLTNNIPKPLLKVGSKPILETILESFIDYNFHNFYISVNYRSELIKAYFNCGSKWGVSIQYLEENKRLGTAGALSLLPSKPTKPVIVMNGDLLTKVNFEHLLNFHENHGAYATMCVREYIHQVSYGVVNTSDHRLINIEEKPVHQYFVNAGIYVLSPEVFDLIPVDEFFDMPALFDKLISKNYETCAFPIHEYWLDIGQMNDYEKANIEFAEVFSG